MRGVTRTCHPSGIAMHRLGDLRLHISIKIFNFANELSQYKSHYKCCDSEEGGHVTKVVSPLTQ